jgi:AraC-like DNA-binding protein
MPSAGRKARWNSSGTASVVVLRPMLTYARTRGVDVDGLLAEVGVVPPSLDEFDRRIPETARCRAWVLAADRARDPSFGLHVAEHARVGAFDVLDYSLYFSCTLGDAFARLIRFHRVLCDAWDFQLMENAGTVRLVRIERTPPHEAEAALALWLLRARELTRHDIVPREVSFEHAALSDTLAHAKLFRAPVRFGRPVSELVFTPKTLSLPIPTGNSGLNRVLERYMSELLARLPKSESFVERVRAAIAKDLLGGRPTLRATARELHASPRTLQRRLNQQGTSYVQAVDSVRRDLAERRVGEGRMSITEIAFLLGFADVSGFRRVYKRWTGLTPSQARPHA